ncbi:hypothetical protein Pyn_39514 [Prunus yedoensis var. nudiflora]|uniref:5MP1/2-like HEAT domain-containing protein n=1 Tax=Prunus yedoensis var. nudiflora TaxID=2094558 RepID=A0A315AKJ6_PRUYE|nr:hypothetical protein Pyn_39514 [Prunus yedoensis var. nudiflora]
MSSKERPTLGGTRIKTRKRNIAAPLDPAAFADAVVQIYLDNAGDLELIAKCIESSDLNFSRYGTHFLRLFSLEAVHNLEQQNLMRGSATLTLY